MYLYKLIVTLISIIFHGRQHEESGSLSWYVTIQKSCRLWSTGILLCSLVDIYLRLEVLSYGM
jgi:hypothetical protein